MKSNHFIADKMRIPTPQIQIMEFVKNIVKNSRISNIAKNGRISNIVKNSRSMTQKQMS